MHDPNKAFQIMGGICPGRMCPRGIFPGGKCPGGKCPLGYMSGGKCPGGTCPGGGEGGRGMGGVHVRGGYVLGGRGGGVVLSPLSNPLCSIVSLRTFHFSHSQSAGLSSVPYVISLVVTYLAGYTADVIRNRGWLRTMWIRRIYTFGGRCQRDVHVYT